MYQTYFLNIAILCTCKVTQIKVDHSTFDDYQKFLISAVFSFIFKSFLENTKRSNLVSMRYFFFKKVSFSWFFITLLCFQTKKFKYCRNKHRCHSKTITATEREIFVMGMLACWFVQHALHKHLHRENVPQNVIATHCFLCKGKLVKGLVCGRARKKSAMLTGH